MSAGVQVRAFTDSPNHKSPEQFRQSLRILT